MKIIDCFIYNNEDLILELRLNFLNKYVDKFILVEAKFDHSGKLKNKFNFDISKFEKFRNKIEYLKIENFPNKFIDWERENYQRNYISNALNSLDKDDQVIISDVDEIPNLQNLSGILNKGEKYTAFKQKMFYYKFNLLNLTESPWYGSKMCKMRYLRSPQWLRDQKVKKYSILKFYKIKWNIIQNGGWHFSYIMNPNEISEKIKSFSHAEYNLDKYTNIKTIEDKLSKGLDLFNRNQSYQKVELDSSFPKSFFENKNKFVKWFL